MSQPSEISLIPTQPTSDSSPVASIDPEPLWAALLNSIISKHKRKAAPTDPNLPFDTVRRKMYKAALISGDLELFRSACKSFGGKYLFKPVYFEEMVRGNEYDLLQILSQLYPDAVRLAANPGDSHSPPIHIAIQSASIQAFEILFPFTTKETVLRYSSDEASILTEASLCGPNFVIDLLTDLPYINDLIRVANADPVQPYSALHNAAHNCIYPTFKKLFDAYSALGSTHNLPTQYGHTVLIIMIYTDALKAKLFIDNIPDHPLLTEPDCFGNMPLHWAAIEGCGEIVNALYTIYATKDLVLTRDTADNLTFFDCLIYFNHSHIIQELLDREDFDSRLLSIPDEPISTPLVHAIMMEHSDICELLYPFSVEAGIIAELRNHDINVLTLAAGFGLDSIVHLITSEPDLCSMLMIGDDEDGHAPLHVAAYFSSVEIYALLYDCSTIEQACLQEKHWGLTALHLTVMYRDQTMIELVLRNRNKARAMMRVKDIDDLTAMDYARMRSPEIVSILEAAMEA